MSVDVEDLYEGLVDHIYTEAVKDDSSGETGDDEDLEAAASIGDSTDFDV